MGCCKKGKGKPKKPPKPGKANCCRAGVCRCWYCCLCLLPFFWVYAMAVFGMSMYYGIRYTLLVDETRQINDVHFLFWGTMVCAFLFVMIIQQLYLMVMFENSTNCCRCCFLTFYVVTMCLCVSIFIGTFFCKVLCPKGRNNIQERAKKENAQVAPWMVTIIEEIDKIRTSCIFTAGMMFAVLHLYFYHILKFVEERNIKIHKERQRLLQLNRESGASRSIVAGVSAPGPQPINMGRIKKPKSLRFFYFNL